MPADENNHQHRTTRPRSTAESHGAPTEELVVLSHLRWDWVWQRPQHLVSRLGRRFDRVVFVEEPLVDPTVDRARLHVEQVDGMRRIWLEIPGEPRYCGFDGAGAEGYADLLADELGEHDRRTVWLYTPLALPHAQRLRPSTLAFDVMDDLASFASASPALRSMHQRALVDADVVFTGGRSLQRGVSATRPDATCLPSGVELEHFAVARELRPETQRTRPVAGYVGVVDERIDLDLLGALPDLLHGWDIQVVGPTAKIDPALLPSAPNLHYLGPRPYAELPHVMAGFDVAIMPFALNEATRSISPTKTMEYLAAGLPVVSTPVPDVVADFAGIVHLADDPPAFADACRTAACSTGTDHGADPAVRRILAANHWDAIAERMYEQLVRCSAYVASAQGERA